MLTDFTESFNNKRKICFLDSVKASKLSTLLFLGHYTKDNQNFEKKKLELKYHYLTFDVSYYVKFKIIIVPLKKLNTEKKLT